MTLTCPLCSEEYLHHGAVTVWNRAEDAEVGRLTTVSGDVLIDAQNATMEGCPSRRRDALSIEFRCEHCHDKNDKSLHLDVIQHKGNTFLQWRK